MPLPETNLTISAVKSAIGATTNKLSSLCTHPNINMWSDKKPGYLNPNPVTHQIEYIRPQGGENDPYKLGDFRGYYHGEAAPYLLGISDFSVNTYPSTSGVWNGNVRVNMVGQGSDIGGYSYLMVRVHNSSGYKEFFQVPLKTDGTDTICDYHLDYNGSAEYTIKVCLSTGQESAYVYFPGDYQFNVSIYQFTQEFQCNWDPYSYPAYGEGVIDPTYLHHSMQFQNFSLSKGATEYTYSVQARLMTDGVQDFGWVQAGDFFRVPRGTNTEIKVADWYPGVYGCPSGPGTAGWRLVNYDWTTITGTIPRDLIEEDDNLRMAIHSVNID